MGNAKICTHQTLVRSNSPNIIYFKFLPLRYNILEKCLDKDANKRPIFDLISRQINELTNSESFQSELSSLTLTEEESQPLYGPHGYLRILPDIHIDTDYQYTSTSPPQTHPLTSSLPSPPTVSSPFTSPPTVSSPFTSPPTVSSPFTSPPPHSSVLTSPPPHSSVLASPPIISVDLNDIETDDGYVNCSPQLSPSPKVIETSFTPRSSPIPPQISERPDSEDESDNEINSPDYYNIHFRPIISDKKTKKK